MMTLTGPAQYVKDFHRTLANKPLMNQAEIDLYYEESIGPARSDQNLVARLALELRQSFLVNRHFRTFVFGHLGCGKSTEFTRLAIGVGDQYQTVRLSVVNELDPNAAKPLDLFLLMLTRLAESAKELDGWSPPDSVIRRVWDWFAEQTTERLATRSAEGQLNAGLGVDQKSMWSALIGVFAQVRAELKISSLVKSERTDYELKRITTLAGVLNEFFDACNGHLAKLAPARKWLMIVEDFEKLPNRKIAEEIFVEHSGAVQQLQISAIFSIPAALAYSKARSGLPFEADCLYDTPIYDSDHRPHPEGREALRRMLAKRIDLARFESQHQAERIVVASGGSPRDLFDLAAEASTRALLAAPDAKPEDVVIRSADVRGAIARLRRQTYLRLGQDPYESEPVSSKEKLDRLKSIYENPSRDGAPDPVLYSLLNSRLLREFNGDGWFGVPPLVVDLFKELAAGPDRDADPPGGLL